MMTWAEITVGDWYPIYVQPTDMLLRVYSTELIGDYVSIDYAWLVIGGDPSSKLVGIHHVMLAPLHDEWTYYPYPHVIEEDPLG